MKKVLKLFKGHKHLVFLDFEGTQFSHEMIAYGALFVTIDKDGHIVKQKKPIKRLVKSKNAIGKFVENLTGITQKDLQKDGISFKDAIVDLKKYCGISFKKSTFITFGNHDMRILSQSAAYNLDSPLDLCKIIKSNYVDFQSVISEFVKDDKNNPLSLAHYLEAFHLDFDGTAHDPLYDAVNLARLYDEFMTNKDVVLDEYLKTLARNHYNPQPVDKVIKRLLNKEVVTSEEFFDYIKDYIS